MIRHSSLTVVFETTFSNLGSGYISVLLNFKHYSRFGADLLLEQLSFSIMIITKSEASELQEP